MIGKHYSKNLCVYVTILLYSQRHNINITCICLWYSQPTDIFVVNKLHAIKWILSVFVYRWWSIAHTVCPYKQFKEKTYICPAEEAIKSAQCQVRQPYILVQINNDIVRPSNINFVVCPRNFSRAAHVHGEFHLHVLLKPWFFILNYRNYKPVLRTKEQMEEMGAFEKPDYTPLPNTSNYVHLFNYIYIPL